MTLEILGTDAVEAMAVGVRVREILATEGTVDDGPITLEGSMIR